ncbi:MAG: methionyl-tRNA formyltransferase [bacterium]|nr:methionyl-tRNA formyltransferase [bacterium]
MKLKVAYFGTPDFSAQFLEKLLTDTSLPIEVKLVVTQPDKPVGRKQVLTSSPVKQMAKKYNIQCVEGMVHVTSFMLQELDFSLLYAYGEIIPLELLRAPKYGFINIHPSLLPYYRGPSPTAYPIFLGEKITGISIMKMDEKIDHGGVIAQEKLEIPETIKRSDLELQLTDLSFEVFKNLLRHSGKPEETEGASRIVVNSLTTIPESSRLARFPRMTLTPQDHSKATYTRMLTKKDGFLPFSTIRKAMNNELLTDEEIPQIITDYFRKNPNIKLQISNQIQNSNGEKIGNSSKIIFDYFRGMYPWPGIWTLIDIKDQQKRLKITDMKLEDGKLVLIKVQLEGKNEVDFETFQKAYGI